ncbi:Bacterial alpha-L-rhamnosidase [Alistipes sp. cv1]|nr:Bacterial alpha-L-rhamnosidase [Faecalibacterium prausnitzii]
MFLLLLSAIFAAPTAFADETEAVAASDRWQKTIWDARWIASGEVSEGEFEAYRFRKTFPLERVPSRFVINISADPRYELFVNGRRVHRGPARGTLQNWCYETLDIAPYLKEGDNVIAATVWNYGRWSGGAQVSLCTGLIVQGETERESAVDTDSSWKSRYDRSLAPSLVYLQDVEPGLIVDGNRYPWGWEQPGYDDSRWPSAVETEPGRPALACRGQVRALVPRTIPLMESRPENAPVIRRSEGINANDNFKKDKPLTVPARTRATLLLDQQYLTNAYPTLTVSGGKGAKISLTYSEAMYVNDREKGNRNEIEGKHIRGFTDVFYPDGQAGRTFGPLWFRCYRYVQMEIETADEGLTVDGWNAEFTGYPFRENGYFRSDDPELAKIWETGWRTARLCAGETYYDCPYYEQMQYMGDTRIQCLISLYVSGDDRLMRRAINDIASSVTQEGILRSRYPTKVDQIIPSFSLYWINCLHDYWMHRDDPDFVRSYLPVLKSVLGWYERKIDPNTGMLGQMPYWNFLDWPKQWPWTTYEPPTGGVPPSGRSGGSSIMTLQLAYTLGDAVELLDHFGERALADKYRRIRDGLCSATMTRCFDSERNLLADDIARSSFSQHASIMGILSGAVGRERERQVFEALCADTTLTPATVYYQFYLVRAMIRAGLADRYAERLDTWRDMIAAGLTTFAEEPEPTRSDCHAWSASPNYYLLATVCGIVPASPGFGSVLVEPHMGPLAQVSGGVPHPKGMIEVDFKKKGDRITGRIVLPEGLEGTYRHGDRTLTLRSGRNEIR